MTETTVTVGPPLYSALGLLMLFIGGALTTRIRWLRDYCIPRPVTGGLLFVAGSWVLAQLSGFRLELDGALHNNLWHLVFSAGPKDQPLQLDQPFLIAFFTCVGLSCSRGAIRAGGRPLVALLIAASLLALGQAVLGISLASQFGVHPALGLACGPVSMTGGHGTTAGFTSLLESTGLEDARAIGFAAATLGLLVGGMLAGPLGSFLVRRHRLSPDEEELGEASHLRMEGTHWQDLSALAARWRRTLLVLAGLVFCFKSGAWLSAGLANIGLAFPVYMGSMIVGALLRNGVDARFVIDIEEVLRALRSLCIAIFLVLALMETSFASLAGVARAMGWILVAQLLLTLAFAAWVTYRMTGRNYGGALVAAGHCGFALGATPNALAGMEAITKRHGSAFRPFLAVSVAGGFFLDFTNALVITAAANLILFWG